MSYLIARILTSEADDETCYTCDNLVTIGELRDIGACAISPKTMAQYQKNDKTQVQLSTVRLEGEELIAHDGKVIGPEAVP